METITLKYFGRKCLNDQPVKIGVVDDNDVARIAVIGIPVIAESQTVMLQWRLSDTADLILPDNDGLFTINRSMLGEAGGYIRVAVDISASDLHWQSYEAKLLVDDTLGLDAPIIEREPTIVEQVAGYAANAEAAREQYPKIGENGNWWVWDVAQGRFVDTGVPASGGGGGGGTSDHTQLTNRSVANQHPISAITNLQSTLDGKEAKGKITIGSVEKTASSHTLSWTENGTTHSYEVVTV